IHLTNYAFRGGAVAEIRENNNYRGETIYSTGTVFRIAVEGGVVKYYKDGSLFYTSSKVPAYPLVVDTSFAQVYGTINNVVIGTSNVPSMIANVSAASYRGNAVAAESIATAYGSNLAILSLAANAVPLPNALGGTTLTVRDSNGTQRPASLFYVSPTQVNYL